MKPQNCPRFSFCSANLCPIDEGLELKNHIKEDELCYYFERWLTNPSQRMLPEIKDNLYKIEEKLEQYKQYKQPVEIIEESENDQEESKSEHTHMKRYISFQNDPPALDCQEVSE